MIGSKIAISSGQDLIFFDIIYLYLDINFYINISRSFYLIFSLFVFIGL